MRSHPVPDQMKRSHPVPDQMMRSHPVPDQIKRSHPVPDQIKRSHPIPVPDHAIASNTLTRSCDRIQYPDQIMRSHPVLGQIMRLTVGHAGRVRIPCHTRLWVTIQLIADR
ncbi:hypothetical protein [Moorena producens]|uniref:hypothetical protein n=1 Tax=Moorena producens TaxID=1155739 RepID=UPI0011EA6D0D|nr:hypothetical protein [Moorena producens]